MRPNYVPVITLSTQETINFFTQLESGSKGQLIEINIYLKQQIKRKTEI